MTGADLIRALADDLEITQASAEDIFNAIRDLCESALLAKKNFPFPGIGTLGRCKERNSPRFDIFPEMRKKLGLREKIEDGLCVDCKKKPRLPRRSKCANCRSKAYRAKQKKK
jgi:nucleoid DNA-binding protein